MLLIFSSNANGSAQVHREVDQAFSNGKVVVPLRVEDVRPADELAYYLNTVHWLDALTPPFESRLRQLTAAVQALLATKELAPMRDETILADVATARAEKEARADDERRAQEVEAARLAEQRRSNEEALGQQKKQAAQQQAGTRRRGTSLSILPVAITVPLIYAGSIAFTWWLVAASTGPADFAWAQWLSWSIGGALLWGGYGVALVIQSLSSIGGLLDRLRSNPSTHGPLRFDDIGPLATLPVVAGMALFRGNNFRRKPCCHVTDYQLAAFFGHLVAVYLGVGGTRGLWHE